MFDIIIFLFLLALGFFVGKWNENRHFQRLEREESELAHIKVYNIRHIPEPVEPGGVLVNGNVVIALDHFKKLMAAIINIVGGQINAYQSVLIRARREAVLRMKREAAALGADAVYNVRIEFSSMGNTPQTTNGAEIVAYGTAVRTTKSTLQMPNV